MAPRTLDAGWAELGTGHWDAARGAFEKAVAEAQTPEGFEGLSWAAWWVDDADAVFESRTRAYALYRRRGDAAGAARMATWLACDHLDFRGAVAVARGWLARADRLLAGLGPGPERGWLAFFEGYLAAGAGDRAQALERAAAAADLGRRLRVADLEMLGLALEGATLVSGAEVRRGMRRLDEATAVAMEGEAEIPISSAWTCCFLVTACSAVRDYERAIAWCDRIAEFAERYGSRYMLAFCRAEYAAVHLWRGSWKDAEALLVASAEDFTRSRPALAGPALAGLAELRRRQGRRPEAEILLDRAGASAAAHVCRGRLALDAGDPLRAAELARRVLRHMPVPVGPDRVPALELLVEGATAHGDLNEGRAALAELRAIERLAATPPLRASADLAEGRVVAAAGDHAAACALLEDAVDGFERAGGRFHAAVAMTDLALSLTALGRADAGRREAAVAIDRLVALGAVTEARRARRVVGGGPPPDERITPRERDVLGLLAEGFTNRQIAERLVVSEHTVHRHVSNLLRKLDVPSRTAAAAYAVREGLAGARE